LLYAVSSIYHYTFKQDAKKRGQPKINCFHQKHRLQYIVHETCMGWKACRRHKWCILSQWQMSISQVIMTTNHVMEPAVIDIIAISSIHILYIYIHIYM